MDDENISFEDSSQDLSCNKEEIEMTTLYAPSSEVTHSLMLTLEDYALQRALQECLTLNDQDCRHRKLTLPVFANEFDMTHKLNWQFDSTRLSEFPLLKAWWNKPELIFSWLGHIAIAKTLLLDTIRCNDGRTLTACAASMKIIEELQKRGANPDKWNFKKCTPLHCAAAVGCVVTMKYLIESGADVDAGLSSRSPLHYAVLNNAADCVEVLIQADACLNNPQVDRLIETPLHVAAKLGNVRCTMLLLSHGADVRLQMGAARSTPLHLAAKKGNAECIRLLLSAHGAVVEVKNSRGQTAMHLATLAQSVETLDMLIKAGASTNAQDDKGRTPLHIAIAKKASSILVETLIQRGALVNKADKSGYTPLHIAALYENSSMAMMLLSKGADVTARTKSGDTALSFIVRRTPDILPGFLKRFDKAISLHDHELGDMNCELELDFMPLMLHGHGKKDLMLCLVEADQGHVLEHPLLETFLHLKWLRIRKIFMLSLMFHFIFVAVFTGYVTATYISNEKNKTLSNILLWFTLGFICVLAAKEIIQISHGIWNYAQHWENWIQCSVILTSSVILISHLTHLVDIWRYDVAALSVLLVWVELMIVIGRFPTFGIYIEMFTQVSINFSKLFAAYICLIIGFSFSFSVLHKNHEPFQNLLVSLLKTVIMMSGEFEFEDIYFPKKEKNVTESDKENDTENEFPPYFGTAHLVFLSFVILVTIILTNLMFGLAVSNIQEIRRCASLDRLKRRAELMAHFENMFSKYIKRSNSNQIIFKILGRTLAKKITEMFFKMVLCSRYLYIRPNDPREKQLPSELIKKIYHLVSERRSRRAMFRGNTPPPPHTAANETSHTKFSKTYSNESNQQQQRLNELMHQLKSLTNKIESIAKKVDTIANPC